MAGRNKSIYVGSFVRDSDNVPARMQGKLIFYARDLRMFAIYDRNTNKTIDYFKMPQYRTFMDASCIEPDTNTIGYIEDEYDRWEAETNAKKASDAVIDDISKEASDDGDYVVNGDRNITDYDDETGGDRAKARSKDPTRHVGSYFVTMLVIALLVILCRVVIIPLVQQLAAVS